MTKVAVTTNFPEHLPAEVLKKTNTSIVLFPINNDPSYRRKRCCCSVRGTHFHNYRGNKRYVRVLSEFFFLFSLARLMGKQIVYLVIGIGPIETWWGCFLIRLLLALAHIVVVCDQESQRVAKSLKCTRTILWFDLACLLAQPAARSLGQEEEKVLGVFRYCLLLVYTMRTRRKTVNWPVLLLEQLHVGWTKNRATLCGCSSSTGSRMRAISVL